jgi:hypothetical protein
MAGLWQNANQVAHPVLESHCGVAKIGFANRYQQIAGQFSLPLSRPSSLPFRSAAKSQNGIF